MCGIFGIYSESGTIHDEDIRRMRNGEILSHRGPDGFGSYWNSNIYLLHRRLSIIDLEGGDQPIFNENKSIAIIFNGEIYNYQELFSILSKKGHIFTTKSDTEVIIHAFEEWGENCLENLRGMFSFAIWDNNKKKLFIARDRLGIKPLYYTRINDKVFFASELKAIVCQMSFKKRIDYNALASYFSLSYIPSPLSIFEGIQKLPAGHYLTITDDHMVIKKFWDVCFEPDYSKDEEYFQNKFNELFSESVKLRMISDVPIGAFLSGGIDSGLVVSNMNNFSQEPIRTFTMGFGGNIGGYHDERHLAKLVSNRFDTLHSEFEVLPNIEDTIEKIVSAFDEPFADDTTIPSYYLSDITSKNVKVALSGLGGDELFGGYERYLGFKISNFYKFIPKIFRDKIILSFVESLPERKDGHYTVNHLKRFVRNATLPEDYRYYGFVSNKEPVKLFNDSRLLKAGFEKCQQMFIDLYNSENAKEPMDKIFYCDFKTYLSEDVLACTDRISMKHSLEVRVPFMDHKLVEFCATIPNKYKIRILEKKYLLRKEAKKQLPAAILKQRKQGFASPMTQWIKTDIKNFLDNTLSLKNLKKHELFNHNEVLRLLEEHNQRKEIHDKTIWSLLIFQTWFNKYM